MFLIIPLVEFRHMLGVDINVHHENPATFLCHVSVSCMERSRHWFLVSLAPSPHAWSPGETRDTNWGAILAHDHAEYGSRARPRPCRFSVWRVGEKLVSGH